MARSMHFMKRCNGQIFRVLGLQNHHQTKTNLHTYFYLSANSKNPVCHDWPCSRGNDLSLIIPNSISIVFMVWILLCSICGFGCSKMEEIIEENSPVRLVCQLFFWRFSVNYSTVICWFFFFNWQTEKKKLFWTNEKFVFFFKWGNQQITVK